MKPEFSRHVRFADCFGQSWHVLARCNNYQDVCSSVGVPTEGQINEKGLLKTPPLHLRAHKTVTFAEHLICSAIAKRKLPTLKIPSIDQRSLMPFDDGSSLLFSLILIQIKINVGVWFSTNPAPQVVCPHHQRLVVQGSNILPFVPFHRSLLRLRKEKRRNPNHRKDQQTNDDALPHNRILPRSPFTNQPPKPATTKRQRTDKRHSFSLGEKVRMRGSPVLRVSPSLALLPSVKKSGASRLRAFAVNRNILHSTLLTLN
jgi:hypothetical protein